jgi:hypothetical protein
MSTPRHALQDTRAILPRFSQPTFLNINLFYSATMSFLNIMVPVETLTSLVGDISDQIDAGRLECCEGVLSEVDRPTTELKRLAEILKESTGVRTSLIL